MTARPGLRSLVGRGDVMVCAASARRASPIPCHPCPLVGVGFSINCIHVQTHPSSSGRVTQRITVGVQLVGFSVLIQLSVPSRMASASLSRVPPPALPADPDIQRTALMYSACTLASSRVWRSA